MLNSRHDCDVPAAESSRDEDSPDGDSNVDEDEEAVQDAEVGDELGEAQLVESLLQFKNGTRASHSAAAGGKGTDEAPGSSAGEWLLCSQYLETLPGQGEDAEQM